LIGIEIKIETPQLQNKQRNQQKKTNKKQQTSKQKSKISHSRTTEL
jgi:hypothetical protein